jgi:hypothetical protein
MHYAEGRYFNSNYLSVISSSERPGIRLYFFILRINNKFNYGTHKSHFGSEAYSAGSPR